MVQSLECKTILDGLGRGRCCVHTQAGIFSLAGASPTPEVAETEAQAASAPLMCLLPMNPSGSNTSAYEASGRC